MRGGTLHVLYSPRAEGCPRLALALIEQEWRQSGTRASVAFLMDAPADLTGEFKAACADVEVLGWRHRGFLRLTWCSLRLMRRLRPERVVCYSLGHHLSVSLAARMVGLVNLVHIGNRPPPRHERSFAKLRFALRLGRFWVTRYVACSATVAQACRVEYGLDGVRVIENGIDLGLFQSLRVSRAKRLISNTGTPLVIGMVASLETSKDQEILIRALAEMMGQGRSVRLHLVGEGSHRAALEGLARALGVDDSITWHGALHDVKPVLEALDVFAFAVTDQEGLGIALVEAMAAGVPVVAADVPAVREVLDNGRHGRIVTERSAKAWADALLEACGHEAPASEAVARYDIARTWQAYLHAARA